MTSEVSNNVLTTYVIGLADDALILGQRLSELCSRAPYLEEDLAISNVALDYIGRASLLYQYAAKLIGGDTTEDTLAFNRNEREYTNLLIHELPNGDFAFTLAKQYLLDVFNNHYLEALKGSTDTELSAIAHKAIKESNYHLARSKPWIRQLALGTEESNERLVTALAEIMDYVNELFLMPAAEAELLGEGISIDRTALKDTVVNEINELFKSVELQPLVLERTIQGGREGIHTEHLGHMLSDMQFLQRSYPGLKW